MARKTTTCWVVWLSLFAICSYCAAEESGRVTEVVDGDTLKVEISGDVQVVRLLGVAAPEIRPAQHFGRESAEFVRELVSGQPVRLEKDRIGDTRDAYGRLLRYVYFSNGVLLNAEIIGRGYAHAMTGFPFSRIDEFRDLERDAREAGRGLWGTTDVPTFTTAEAAEHVGELARVCGHVSSARYLPRAKGRPTFLNLDGAYPNQAFTVVIWGSEREAFEEPENVFHGRQLCITGTLELHGDVPQIVARDPSQIEIRDGPAD